VAPLVRVRFDGDRLPVWHEPTGRYLDPETGELLPTWDDALDGITDHDSPRHVARDSGRSPCDRKQWLTDMLGLPATDPAAYRWESVQPGDEDYLPPARRLLHTVAERLRWERALTEARRRARDALADELSANGRAA
jgi:hypothetical protein